MAPLIFAMPGSEATVEKLASALGAKCGTTTAWRLPDREPYVRVEFAVEGWWVAIVCTLDRPDDKLIPLPLLAAAARENGAIDVGLVTSYLAHMRQDSCFQPGEAVSARYFAAWLSCGFDWLITIDPHLHRITKLSQIYVIPTRHIHTTPVVTVWLRAHVTRPVFVGPDEESNQWVADVASRADVPMAVLHKVRRGDRDVEVSALDVERWRDHMPVLVDDIAPTGRTMAETISYLRRAGLAVSVYIAIHTMFLGNAVQDLEFTGAGLVVGCDTVVHPANGISAVPDLVSTARELMQDPGGAT